MTRRLVDSNVLIDALAGVQHGVRVLREARNRAGTVIVYSSITRIEVLGFPGLTDQEEAAIRRLLSEFEEIPISNAVIERTIQFRKLTRIKIPDAIIAASADTAHATLITRNISDFQRIPGLTVILPDAI